MANPDPAQVNKPDLARWMIRRALPNPPARMSVTDATVELSLTEVSAKSDLGLWALRHVSLDLRRGEILGVAGAAETIHRLFLEQRQRGCAILLWLVDTHAWEAYHEMARGAFGSVYSLSETLVAFLLVPDLWGLLYWTRLGLKIRAVGEHPRSADAMGITLPTYLLMMAPYVFTILALVIASGRRARSRLGTPAALGMPPNSRK